MRLRTRPGRAEDGTEPDYRFSLANERTFLAYVRTALALDAGGLAVAHLFDGAGTERLGQAAGAGLIALGVIVAVAGYRRWRVNQRAMRMGQALPRTSVGMVLTAVVGLVSAVAVALVLAA